MGGARRIRTWAGLGGGTKPVHLGRTVCKVRFKLRRGSMYYRGFSADIHAGGNTDWGSHGYVTHRSQILVTIGDTNAARVVAAALGAATAS